MTVEEERRFALLQAATDSDYVKKFHGGYLNVFAAALGGQGEKWDVFHVVGGEFPEPSDLHKYQGFVVSGSPHDAYSNEHWVLQLCFLLQTLFAMQKKVLGVCFGHQVCVMSRASRELLYMINFLVLNVFFFVCRCCVELWGVKWRSRLVVGILELEK